MSARAEAELQHLIQWYPGHMARAMRKIGEYLSLIDIVVEAVDARVPRSGRNPALDRTIGKRARLLVLTRSDLADPHATKAWIAHFAAGGLETIAVDARSQQRVGRVRTAAARLASGRKGVSRAMVVGIPNSGKSSIINGLLRRAAARTEDRAGVTRQLQWFRLPPNVELMDTPGILVPKIADKAAQWKLALCAAVPRERYEPEEVVRAFERWLRERYPNRSVPGIDEFAAARGFVRRGGEIDYHNAAQSYIRAANAGEFGRFTLEFAGERS
ncbi:MAG: ribosome biogenesis GTPase YlqF [Candidatus Eremiobacteraeota bacterium]|nr:ribosome biogenesis GTPase YlqF [Candidatus Eremiobacteraeota bacterium]